METLILENSLLWGQERRCPKGLTRSVPAVPSLRTVRDQVSGPGDKISSNVDLVAALSEIEF